MAVTPAACSCSAATAGLVPVACRRCEWWRYPGSKISAYGKRLDGARFDELSGLLDARWQGAKGKRYRTLRAVLREISNAWNSASRLSAVSKSSIAATLGMHRNTVSSVCKQLADLGLIVQGFYQAYKANRMGRHIHTYSIFSLPSRERRLPLSTLFQGPGKFSAVRVGIRWSIAAKALEALGYVVGGVFRALDRWRRPLDIAVDALDEALEREENGDVEDAGDSKIVHRTYYTLEGNRDRDAKNEKRAERAAKTIEIARGSVRHRRESWQSSPKGRQASFADLPNTPFVAARWDDWDDPERPITSAESCRRLMALHDEAFWDLPSFKFSYGFPRGAMRKIAREITRIGWPAIVESIRSRPVLAGRRPMRNGAYFELDFYWLLRSADYLIATSPLKWIPKRPDPIDGAALERAGAAKVAKREGARCAEADAVMSAREFMQTLRPNRVLLKSLDRSLIDDHRARQSPPRPTPVPGSVDERREIIDVLIDAVHSYYQPIGYSLAVRDGYGHVRPLHIIDPVLTRRYLERERGFGAFSNSMLKPNRQLRLRYNFARGDSEKVRSLFQRCVSWRDLETWLTVFGLEIVAVPGDDEYRAELRRVMGAVQQHVRAILHIQAPAGDAI